MWIFFLIWSLTQNVSREIRSNIICRVKPKIEVTRTLDVQILVLTQTAGSTVYILVVESLLPLESSPTRHEWSNTPYNHRTTWQTFSHIFRRTLSPITIHTDIKIQRDRFNIDNIYIKYSIALFNILSII